MGPVNRLQFVSRQGQQVGPLRTSPTRRTGSVSIAEEDPDGVTMICIRPPAKPWGHGFGAGWNRNGSPDTRRFDVVINGSEHSYTLIDENRSGIDDSGFDEIEAQI